MPDQITIGRFANALKFAGTGIEYVAIASDTVFDQNADFSVSGFVSYTSNTTDQRFVTKQFNVTPTDCYGMISGYYVGFINFAIYAASGDSNVVGIRCSFTPVIGKTYHICLVKSTNTSTGWKIYIDGVAQTTSNIVAGFTTLAANPNNTLPIYLGVISPAHSIQQFSGYFKEVSWYNKALTATEVLALYQKEGTTPASAYGNRVDRWPFREKQGTTLHSQSGLHDGTLVNFGSTALGSSNAWRDAYTLQAKTS